MYQKLKSPKFSLSGTRHLFWKRRNPAEKNPVTRRKKPPLIFSFEKDFHIFGCFEGFRAGGVEEHHIHWARVRISLGQKVCCCLEASEQHLCFELRRLYKTVTKGAYYIVVSCLLPFDDVTD